MAENKAILAVAVERKKAMNVIKMLEEALETHRDWAEYFEQNPRLEYSPEYTRLGGAKFHRAWEAKYRKAISEHRDLQARLDKEKGEHLRLKNWASEVRLLTVTDKTPIGRPDILLVACEVDKNCLVGAKNRGKFIDLVLGNLKFDLIKYAQELSR